MNSFTLFLALTIFATLLCRTETEECRFSDTLNYNTDWARCGYRCHGNWNTCTCGKQNWTGGNWDQGCCPSSPDSCIKDNDGKTLFLKRETKILISSFLSLI